MKNLLLIGATGLVGSQVLQQALASPDIANIIALTRRPLNLSTSLPAKLNNIVVDFDNLPDDADWWQVDAIICTLGTTIKKAVSKEKFYQVDFHYPYRVAQIAIQHQVKTFVLNSSIGANPNSRTFYSSTKGQLEQALSTLNFNSFISVRPSLIAGKRAEFRWLEQLSLFVLTILSPIIPKRYRAVEAQLIAHTLLNAALIAKPGYQIIESEAIC